MRSFNEFKLCDDFPAAVHVGRLPTMIRPVGEPQLRFSLDQVQRCQYPRPRSDKQVVRRPDRLDGDSAPTGPSERFKVEFAASQELAGLSPPAINDLASHVLFHSASSVVQSPEDFRIPMI